MKKSKQEIKQLREKLAAYHRGSRQEEIDEHNGKPFTGRHLPTPKNKYNRKKVDKPGRDEY